MFPLYISVNPTQHHLQHLSATRILSCRDASACRGFRHAPLFALFPLQRFPAWRQQIECWTVSRLLAKQDMEVRDGWVYRRRDRLAWLWNVGANHSLLKLLVLHRYLGRHTQTRLPAAFSTEYAPNTQTNTHTAQTTGPSRHLGRFFLPVFPVTRSNKAAGKFTALR